MSVVSDLPYQVSIHELSHPHQANLYIRQELFQRLLSSAHEHLNLSKKKHMTKFSIWLKCVLQNNKQHLSIMQMHGTLAKPN
jgi:hypothetical protein